MNHRHHPHPNGEFPLDDNEEVLLGTTDYVFSPFKATPTTHAVMTKPEWDDPYAMSNNTNDSSGTSPLTTSQGVSPPGPNDMSSFPFGDPDQSLSSISDVLQEEKDFMAYVMSFPSTVPSVPPQELLMKKSQPDAKVGLDHLDNLCKLMEQLSDLKETNIKLRRRVQYLEDIKTLHEIHKEMVGERMLYSSGLSEDEVQQLKNKLGVEREPSEESFDDHIHLEPPAEEQLHGLYRSKTANQIGEYSSKVDNARGHKSRSATASKERRERSKSVGHPGHSKNKKRPSRWSKVKEVLGIERNDEGSPEGASDAQVEERVQEKGNRKDSEQSKAYKLSCSKSHSSVLSSRSFSEAERQSCTTPVDLAKKSGTLDSKTAKAAMESLEKEMAIKKSPKTTWGKMKTMIQIRRDHRHQKSESSSSSPRDPKPTKSSEATNGHSPRRNQRNNHKSSYGDPGMNGAAGESSHHGDRQHQRLDVAYPSEHRHRQKSPKSPSRKSSVPQLESEGKARLERDPDPTQRCRQDELDAYLGLREPTIPKEGTTKRKKFKSRPPPLDYPPPCDPPMDMSPSAHKKWMWTRVKDALKGAGGKRGEEEDGHFSLSAPSSPASEAIAFDFDIDKAKEESFSKPPGGGPRSSEGGGGPLLLGPNHPSATVAELMLELQQNLSDDFNKKLEEWQRCRMGEGVHKPSAEVERKDSFGRVRKVSKPEKKMSTGEKLTKSTHHLPKKDLSWLEKEQQKVDREIIRLSKEKQKFEKRSFHLKQLKESLTDVDGGPKREVFVKTSAGEFRFEGISDAFTKKLYEWEAKKGVVSPELSTIALLDESLKPTVEVSAPTAASVGSNSTRTSPEPPKSCYQVSRASSEPDLSTTQKDSAASNQGTMRSKSGDTLLTSGEIEVASLEGEVVCKLESEARYPIHHSEDNYYSLLEENMYLIDQLKDKEEICSYLQNELERLDDKTEKANRTHKEEMEKYRLKLWEIHMSRPRDLQGSLHLISELKSRIEELQKCSDELKSDRERLEESFRYHSNQQARLADDLIRKVREMQITNTSIGFSRGGSRRKWRKHVKCDPISITRMHDLSTQLLQQVSDIEQMLMERTRQVCHLRWELLHRDMSAVLLQAALHRVTSQGEPVTILPTWDKRRNRFKNIKAWSVDTTTRRPSEDLVNDDWLQERLRQLSMTPYNDWTNIDFSPNDLMTTAHELKKEALRLSLSRPDSTSYESEEKKSGVCSAESEMADSDRCYDTGSAVNSRSSSFSSGGGGLRGSHSDTRLYERSSRALRRGSSSSMSCVENSDSSSFHDSERMQVRRFPWRPQWRSVENVSSSCSSRSSILDDEMRSQWRPSRSNRNAEAMSLEDTPHLQQKYGSFRETDEENEESRIPPSMEWGSQCLITPKPIHLPNLEQGRGETRSPDSTRNYSPHVGRGYSYSRHAKPSYAEMRDFRLPRSTMATVDGAKPLALAEDDGLLHQEGSMESLDKYETAIRDEELTVSDEYDRPKVMQSFSSFEEDLKQRTLKQSNSSVVHVPHNCIADYIDKERGATSADHHHGKQSSTPGSPNISKFKYKGTKGFGRSSRIGLSKPGEEKASLKNFKDSEIQHVDI